MKKIKRPNGKVLKLRMTARQAEEVYWALDYLPHLYWNVCRMDECGDEKMQYIKARSNHRKMCRIRNTFRGKVGL